MLGGKRSPSARQPGSQPIPTPATGLACQDTPAFIELASVGHRNLFCTNIIDGDRPAAALKIRSDHERSSLRDRAAPRTPVAAAGWNHRRRLSSPASRDPRFDWLVAATQTPRHILSLGRITTSLKPLRSPPCTIFRASTRAARDEPWRHRRDTHHITGLRGRALPVSTDRQHDMARAAAVIGRLGKIRSPARTHQEAPPPLIHLRIGVGPQLHAGLTPRPPVSPPSSQRPKGPWLPHTYGRPSFDSAAWTSLPTLPGGISRPVSIRGDGRRPPDPPPLEPPPNRRRRPMGFPESPPLCGIDRPEPPPNGEPLPAPTPPRPP